MKRPSFEDAKARYVHRYTMEHVPAWALAAPDSGVARGEPVRPGYYAPHFRTDREWYDSTVFPGEDHPLAPPARTEHCYTTRQTWPLGRWLDKPYQR